MQKIIPLFYLLFICSCATNTKQRCGTMAKQPLPKRALATVKAPVSHPHQIWEDILQKNVDKKGRVNYHGIAKDSLKLKRYLQLLAKKTPDTTWYKNKTLAYWINAYNAFTVYLILQHKNIESIKSIKNPWKKKFISLENKTYSLHQIEHRILRKMQEPRIHFAINCASISCPDLASKAYNAQNIEALLEKQTKAFINDTSKNKIHTNTLKLSKIFSWFAKDFGTNKDLIIFLNRYSNIPISLKASKTFLPYNWGLNKS